MIGTEMDEIRVFKFTVGLEGKAFPKRCLRGDAAVRVQRLCARLSKLSLFSPHAQDLEVILQLKTLNMKRGKSSFVG